MKFFAPCLALALTASGLTTATASLAVPEVLRMAGAYVRHFNEQFAVVVSDEAYEQRLVGRASEPPVTRHTRAEMLFFYLPAEGTWLTVRNVLQADGRAVAGRAGMIADALSAPDDTRVGQLRRLLDANARFNLGRTTRTFNYPTFTLAYLDPSLQSRFEFSLAGTERHRGAEVAKVAFIERLRPTIIQGDGVDRVSRGAVWLQTRDGSPIKTRLELTMRRGEGNSYATVEVDYEPNEKLHLAVPVRMREQYTEMRAGTTVETLTANATYTNFRRFETSGRVVAPPSVEPQAR